VRLSNASATPPASAATAPPTPEWDQLLWDQTDPCSLRWAASVQMEAQDWAARLPVWVLCLTSRMIGPTQKPINFAWMMTVGN